MATAVSAPDVLYFPFHDVRKWDREGWRTRDAHICRELLNERGQSGISVADRPTCLAELARLSFRWRAQGRTLRSAPGAALILHPTGAVVTDCLAPELGFVARSFHLWLMRAYGSKRYVATLKRFGQIPRASEGLVWLCHPMAVAFLSHTERVRVVVDAFDNFSTHPEFPERARIALEQLYGKVCALADRIVVKSEATQHFIWERWRRDTLLVPNGVRPELFANVVPMELSGVERPIVGYAGKLGRRIDVALLRSLAENLRRGTIVLAGQSLNWRWMSAAIGHRRIQSVGDLHYSRLPNFLAACDVCIVPHRVGQGENGGDATKIYEYLARHRSKWRRVCGCSARGSQGREWGASWRCTAIRALGGSGQKHL